MNQIKSENRNIHESNKREAFDAMRAYHQSEISHKAHAVDMLKAILQTSILVYGGLFGLMLKDGIEINLVQMAGIVTIFVNSFISFRIVYITNEKIRNDNVQYCLHYFEYRKERELLGLEEDLISNNFISKSQEINKLSKKSKESNSTICEKLSKTQSSGHSHTQNILKNFAAMITIVCSVGTVGLILLGTK